MLDKHFGDSAGIGYHVYIFWHKVTEKFSKLQLPSSAEDSRKEKISFVLIFTDLGTS